LTPREISKVEFSSSMLWPTPGPRREVVAAAIGETLVAEAIMLVADELRREREEEQSWPVETCQDRAGSVACASTKAQCRRYKRQNKVDMRTSRDKINYNKIYINFNFIINK
jgi:hypothetical protein